ncbi:unnamed protein product [Aphanomyces euteiches]
MLKNLVKRALRKDWSDNDDTPRKSIAVKKRGKARRKDTKGSKLLDSSTVRAITKAVVEKRKMSSTEMCQVFEKLDEDELGLVDEAAFVKGLTKLGMKLKPDMIESLVKCFRQEIRSTKKNTPNIDYYGFVDFAIHGRDNEQLSEIGDKMRSAIASHEKNGRPWNAMEDLQRLDKKSRQRISADTFQNFLESNRSIEFDLTMKEVSAILTRFEFEYEDGSTGIDYTHFAQWLQPKLHLDIEQLHTQVQRLIQNAQDNHGISLKTIFEEVDDDENGRITRMELRNALLDMGLPLTDTQIYLLMDEYDVDGDGNIEYREFMMAFAPKDGRNRAETMDESDDDKKISRSKSRTTSCLIPIATQNVIQQSVRNDKRKRSSKELCAVFEKYDKKERGLVDDATFAKCIGKLGIKLKSNQVKILADCFRQTKKSQGNIDYYSFIDYAIDIPDSTKLIAIGNKLNEAITKYDKEHSEPFNLLEEMKAKDGRGRNWLRTDIARKYFESGSLTKFGLTTKELGILIERFEFDFDEDVKGIDYIQLATWLQPSLHLDTTELHKHVLRLIEKAKGEYNLSLKDIFEEIDEDGNGVISRHELQDALQSMGIPVTQAQIKFLVDEYDTNGDGKIEYKEFALAFAGKDKHDNDSGTEDEAQVVKKTRSSSMKGQALVPLSVLETIERIIKGNRKLSPSEFCSAFEKLDRDETGLLDEVSFVKALTKLGIKLKSHHTKTIVECFRMGKFKKKSHSDIDYYKFVDFAFDVLDNDTISAIGDKMRQAMNKSNSTSRDEPYNILQEMIKLDKRKQHRLKPQVVREFLERNTDIEFALSQKEMTKVIERFTFDYYDSSQGVDYEQMAMWLQPKLHTDMKDLHKHVKKLFMKASKECKLSMKQIFEDIDDDGNGHISFMELRKTLRDLGIPISEAQMKCLVDDYDLDGDGKIQYSEFLNGFCSQNDDEVFSSDDNNEGKSSKNGQKPKKKKELLTEETEKAIEIAFTGKRRRSPIEQYAVFEQFDKDDSGYVDEATFSKCLTKLGVHLKKDQLKRITECFRKGKGEVDYYGFVDFAANIRKSSKLVLLAKKMRNVIENFDKKNADLPFNIMNDLRRLDRNDKLRLKPHVFRDYLISSKPINFDLSDKEIDLLEERFLFEYSDKSIGVDYELFSKWLQPKLHMDMDELQAHVKALFSLTAKHCKMSLKDIFNEVDEDNSGFLTRKEFQNALQNMRLPLSEMQMTCLMDSYDSNGDGKIDYKEFISVFGTYRAEEDTDTNSSGSSGAEARSFRKKLANRWSDLKRKVKKRVDDTEEDKSQSDKEKKTLAAIKK